MSEELRFPVVQPVPVSPTDRTRRKAKRSSCSPGEFIGNSDEMVAALESE